MFDGLFQPTHLAIIFVVALLVFGPKKLPELGKGLGEGIKSFKKGIKEATEGASDPKPAETAYNRAEAKPESTNTKSEV